MTELDLRDATDATVLVIVRPDFKDTDELGVWRPKNLRSQPKALNKITYHYYPLHLDATTTEGREVDITFRLALIAKLLGWPLDHV